MTRRVGPRPMLHQAKLGKQGSRSRLGWVSAGTESLPSAASPEVDPQLAGWARAAAAHGKQGWATTCRLGLRARRQRQRPNSHFVPAWKQCACPARQVG